MKFEDFFHTGRIIADDFNEIDKNLANPEKIFKELKNFNETGGDGRDRFSSLWGLLEKIYDEFKKKLRERNCGFEGMVLKAVAEEPDMIISKIREKIIFAGFNALSGAERKIVSLLIKRGVAEIIFEMDSYIINNEDQEAGKFIREYLNSGEFGENIGVVDNELTGGAGKKIKILSTSSKSGQAKIIGSILKNERNSDLNPEDVAILLPDESLLFPILNSLPDKFKKGNISLGYPLAQTSLYSLLKSIVECHKNGAGMIWVKDLLKVIAHPYMSVIFSEESKRIFDEFSESENTKVEKIVSGDLLFENIFSPKADLNELLNVIRELLERFNEIYLKDEKIFPGIEMEFVFHFYSLILKLEDVMKRSGIAPGIEGFDRIFSELAAISHIPFTGEPLEGIQILGLLESRNLSFKKLFIPSVNEGVFPKKISKSTFIPLEVRKANALPPENSSDSIYAYIFYRLLKNSEDVTLIYTDETVGSNKGEKSRFISQLQLEYVENYSKADIIDMSVIFPFESRVKRDLEIKKRETHLNILKKQKFSASSLKTYLMCPLRFYFRYILNLMENKNDDPQDPAVYGSLIHKVLEEIYRPAVNSTVNSEYLGNYSQSRIEDIIKLIFNRSGITEIDTGKSRIVFEILKKFVNEFIRKENEAAPFEILSVEERLTGFDITFGPEDNEHTVILKGQIDRIDRKEGMIRIIDYKSGRVGDLRVAGLTGADKNKWSKTPEVFQLLFYAYLLNLSGRLSGDFMLGIYPLKNFYGLPEFVKIQNESVLTLGNIVEFEEVLVSLLTDIFNPEIPFTQTEDRTVCGFCPYLNICGREKRREVNR